MANPLSDAEIEAFLSGHPGWRLEAGMICKTYEAPTFLEGIRFVSEVARLAEAANHHPDIDIRWRNVTLRLVTHDAGNRVTQKDTALAHEAELVFKALAPPR